MLLGTLKTLQKFVKYPPSFVSCQFCIIRGCSTGATERESTTPEDRSSIGLKNDQGLYPLRLLVQNQYVDKIESETIERLQSDYGAHISITNCKSVNKQVFRIHADKEQRIKVLKECLPLIGEPSHRGKFRIEFLVIYGYISIIIGKGGKDFKQLKDDTKAKIHISEKCLPVSDERVVTIGGREGHVTAAVEQLMEVLTSATIQGGCDLYEPELDPGEAPSEGGEGKKKKVKKKQQETTRVTVTRGMARLIIGRGGETVKGLIRQSYGAAIHIEGGNKEEEVVHIKGGPDQVYRAKQLILKFMEDHQAEADALEEAYAKAEAEANTDANC